ncbi:unnamed protein product [Closterium sp. NIES-64]|nr:unnamed protein product [Closterium sp. NIES-64]
MPRLLHHVAETTVRHTSSKRYAECARTYGQQMALHVPKVMTALVRALAAGAAAANGSSMASSGGAAAAAGGTPGGGGGRSAASLHAACADVVVEMATHCVAPPHDPTADSAAAAETQIVLAAICDPLAAELAEQHHRHVQQHHAPGAGGGGGGGAVAAGGAEHDALAGAARCLLALQVPKESQEGAFKALTAALGGVHRPLALLQLACDLCHLDASLAKCTPQAACVSSSKSVPASSPLASSPLASSPLASSPLASSPLASSPLASSPLASSPLASSPLASSPLASSPLASSPLASSPLASSPLASSPLVSALQLHCACLSLPVHPSFCPHPFPRCQFHAKTLLRAGKEVLRGAASVEHRLYAVRLLKDAMRRGPVCRAARTGFKPDDYSDACPTRPALTRFIRVSACARLVAPLQRHSITRAATLAAVFQAELRDVVALLREAANHPKLKPDALAAGKAIQDKKKHCPRPGATSSASKAAARWRPDTAPRAPHAHPADGPRHATPGAGSSSSRSPAWMGGESDESKVGEGRQHGWQQERRAEGEGEGEGPTSPTHSAASSSAARTAPLAIAPAVPALAAAQAASQPSEPPPRDPTLYFTPLPALPHHASSLHSSTHAAAAAAEAEAGGAQGAAASEGSWAFQSPPGQFTAFQARGTATFTTTAVHGSALSATPPPSAPYSARSPASLSHLGPSPSLYLGPGGSTQRKAFVSPDHGVASESPDDMRSVRRRVFEEEMGARDVPRSTVSPDPVPFGSAGQSFDSNIVPHELREHAAHEAWRGPGGRGARVVEHGEQENAGAGGSGHKAMGRAAAANGAGNGGREWSPTSESSRGNARSSLSPSTSGEGREAVRGGKARSPHSRGNSPLYELAAAFVRARKSPDLSGRLGTFSLTSGSPDQLGAYRLGGSRMAGGALGGAAGGGGGRGSPMRITLSGVPPCASLSQVCPHRAFIDSAMAPDSAHAGLYLERSRHLTSPLPSPPSHSQPPGSRQVGTGGGVGKASGQAGFLLHLPPHAGTGASAQGARDGAGSRAGAGGSVGMGSSGVFVRLSGDVEHGGGAARASTGCKAAGEGGGGNGKGAVLAAHLAVQAENTGTHGSGVHKGGVDASDGKEGAVQASAAAGSSPGSSSRAREGSSSGAREGSSSGAREGSSSGAGEGSSSGALEGSSGWEGSSGFCRLISDAEVASALASMRATHALSALRSVPR